MFKIFNDPTSRTTVWYLRVWIRTQSRTVCSHPWIDVSKLGIWDNIEIILSLVLCIFNQTIQFVQIFFSFNLHVFSCIKISDSHRLIWFLTIPSVTPPPIILLWRSYNPFTAKKVGHTANPGMRKIRHTTISCIEKNIIILINHIV